MNLRVLSLACSPLLFGAAAALLPVEAAACGGTFCDQANNNMPVDQTGENILFVLAEDHTEAHIQIQYDPETDAEKFGWIVPMLGVPEFSVGSQQLFVNLLNATVPVYGFMSQAEFCGYDESGGGWDTCSGTSGASSASGGDSAGSGGTTGTTGEVPDVLLRTTVGAFDVVVLDGDNAGVVMDWLGDAGYYQDPAAEPILQEYLDDGYIFAAFKLTQGAGVDEIHPVTLRYPGNEPCVPIKLTRIAAQPDMDIRTFFLGSERVGPSNYHNVVVNEAQLDWPNFASNYKEVVSLAVDEEPANGHGFVTEYAGASAIVGANGLYSGEWDHTPFAELKPYLVVDELQAQGLMECNGGRCTYNHPLLVGLLYQFLPVPDGLEEGEFYACLECFEGLIDADAYDPLLFSDALLERIIEPGLHAVELLDTWPFLTRMYTTLSPEEMTEDPVFHQNGDLPEVDMTSNIATQYFPCSGSPQWWLPSGFTVPGNFQQTWPMMPAEMPYAQRIEMIPPVGAPQVEVDNSQLITMLLEALGVASEPIPRDCHDSSAGGSITDSDTDESATAGTGGIDDEGLCACRSDGRAPDPVLAGLGLLLAGGVLRRRRRDSPPTAGGRSAGACARVPAAREGRRGSAR
jgi:MYXO-CTERM domain-containing protein